MDTIEIIGLNVALRCKVFQWKDHGHHMAYMPSLDLTGYGETPDQAKEMLDFSAKEYCEWLALLPQVQLDAELARLGWEKGKPSEDSGYTCPYVDREGALQGFELDAEEFAQVEEMYLERVY